MSKKRSWLGNIGLLAGTFLVFFGGIEIMLRVTGVDSGRPHTPPIYQKSDNPKLSYELKPNLHEEAFRSTVITDRRGFRSAEVHPGKPIIAIIGDSIAFGYGLENEQTLGAQLSKLLDDRYNVVSAASPGYTLGQQAALYGEKVDVLHPQTLVVVFYWNDLTDFKPAVLDDDGNLQAPDWIPGTPTCHPIEDGALGYLPGRCWLDLHSAFYRTMKKLISARVERKNLEEQKTEYRKNAFADPVTQEQLHRYAQTLGEFSKSLPKNMQKLFVIWPEKQLHLKTTSQLMAMAEAAGFQTLNLYEVFGNRSESLPWDTVHPSAKTVEEAAAVIKAALEQWKHL